jgi:hypothetical protein
LSGSIGASIINTIWERREAVYHETLAEAINPYNSASQQALHSLQQAGMSEAQSGAYLAREITRQGFVMGSNEIFFFTEGLIFPDYVAVIQVRQDSAKASSVRKPCRRYDLLSGQAGVLAAERLDHFHIVLAILKQGGVQVVELSVQFAFPLEDKFWKR